MANHNFKVPLQKKLAVSALVKRKVPNSGGGGGYNAPYAGNGDSVKPDPPFYPGTGIGHVGMTNPKVNRNPPKIGGNSPHYGQGGGRV